MPPATKAVPLIGLDLGGIAPRRERLVPLTQHVGDAEAVLGELDEGELRDDQLHEADDPKEAKYDDRRVAPKLRVGFRRRLNHPKADADENEREYDAEKKIIAIERQDHALGLWGGGGGDCHDGMRRLPRIAAGKIEPPRRQDTKNFNFGPSCPRWRA